MNELLKLKLNLILVTVVFCLMVKAQDYPEELVGVAKNGTPTLDADIEDDWGEGYTFQGMVSGGISDGDADISGTWYALWSEDGLYVACKIMDDYLNWGENDLNSDGTYFYGGAWEYDCIMVFINPTGERNPDDETYATANASQIFFNPLDGTADYNNTAFGYAEDYLDSLTWESQEVTGGYIVEALIPWEVILPDPTTIPEKIGFTINVSDTDDLGYRESILLWVGAGLPDLQWCNINYFGVLELSDEAAIGPNIEVYDDTDTELIEGSTINFGEVNVEISDTTSFQIGNSGYEDLILDVAVNGNGFSVIGSTNYTISPEDTIEVQISYSPNDTITNTGSIVITSNDENENPYTLNLIGKGFILYPDIAVYTINDGTVSLASSIITFEKTVVGQEDSKLLSIENKGENTLTAAIATEGDGYTVDKSIVEIAVDESEFIIIEFSPVEDGLHLGTLTIISNDPDESTLEYDLVGEGEQTVNIEKEIMNDIIIHPNPAGQYIQLKGQNGISTIKIYDILGRKLLEKNCSNNGYVDVSGLTRGQYIIKITNKSNIITKSLIIK